MHTDILGGTATLVGNRYDHLPSPGAFDPLTSRLRTVHESPAFSTAQLWQPATFSAGDSNYAQQLTYMEPNLFVHVTVRTTVPLRVHTTLDISIYLPGNTWVIFTLSTVNLSTATNAVT